MEPKYENLHDLFIVDDKGIHIDNLMVVRLIQGYSRIYIDREAIEELFMLDRIYSRIPSGITLTLIEDVLEWIINHQNDIDDELLERIFNGNMNVPHQTEIEWKSKVYHLNEQTERYVNRLKLTKGELLWLT